MTHYYTKVFFYKNGKPHFYEDTHSWHKGWDMLGMETGEIEDTDLFKQELIKVIEEGWTLEDVNTHGSYKALTYTKIIKKG